MTDLVVTKSSLMAFEPQDFSELMRFADLMARSEMVPKDFVGKPGNIVAAVIAGRELGLSAWRSLQSFAVIKGRATLWGDAVLGLVRSSSHCEWVREWSEGEGDAMVAFCEVKRNNQEGTVLRSFSVADARTARLWGKTDTPWVTYPQRMLQMRARSWALRDAFPDVLSGTVIREEVEDYDEPRDVTPQGETRNAQLRSHLAGMMGAAAMSGEQTVEDPQPKWAEMLGEQISEALVEAARGRDMPADVYRETVATALDGKKLRKTTAPLVWKAIMDWQPPEIEAVPDEQVPLFEEPPE